MDYILNYSLKKYKVHHSYVSQQFVKDSPVVDSPGLGIVYVDKTNNGER